MDDSFHSYDDWHKDIDEGDEKKTDYSELLKSDEDRRLYRQFLEEFEPKDNIEDENLAVDDEVEEKVEEWTDQEFDAYDHQEHSPDTDLDNNQTKTNLDEEISESILELERLERLDEDGPQEYS